MFSFIQARFMRADISFVSTMQKWPRDSQQPLVLLGFEPRPTETSAPRTTAGPRQIARTRRVHMFPSLSC